MEERFRLVEEWKSGDWSMAELCRFYGVTRVTGYKWVERYESGGMEALRDLSRAPKRHPNEVGEEMEDLVIAEREKHPSWGAPKIRARLSREHPDQNIPAESTIGAILKRHDVLGTKCLLCPGMDTSSPGCSERKEISDRGF